MIGFDYCADPVLRKRLKGQAATIKNRETREDALQEAFCDILALAPVSMEDAFEKGKAAIHRIEWRDRNYCKRQTDGEDAIAQAQASPRYAPEYYTA